MFDNLDGIEESVVKLLKEKNYTLTTAESCTGGKIAARLVNVSGVSSVYEKGLDRKSTRLNSSHTSASRMPSSA